MNYCFFIEGESVDGDVVTEQVEFENCVDSLDALHLAENEAKQILEDVDGGNVDIFDENNNLLVSVEI